MGEAVVSGRDPAEVLEAAKHVFDGVSVAIEAGREAVFPSPIGLRRDVWRDTLTLNLATDSVAVITLVGMQERGGGHPVQQAVGGDTVGYLAAG